MTGEIAWTDWLLWGFGATAVLTVLLAGGQGLGLTRMSIPYLLGSLLTSDRDRARFVGIVVHFVNGWVFSLIYVLAFHHWGGPSWWKGGAIGFVHAAFVLAVLMPALPAVHPRMASETRGPTVVRQLEPPGFLGLHYGTRTPLSALVAHLVFGVLLGAFYVPA
jgi:uncharacterized membrane protein YagU involved in acid resistance